MWRPCLALLLAASASGLRGRGLAGWEGPHHEQKRKELSHHKHKHNVHQPKHKGLKPTEPRDCDGAHATENVMETQNATQNAMCGPFPGQHVVLVTVSADFMPFFQNWLHYSGPFLTSSEQVVAFAEDEEVVPMLRRVLHEGTRTRFKIAIPANEEQTAWDVTMASDRSYSQDVYEIRIQDIHPFGSKAYKEVVSQRPREIRHFLDQNCSVLYSDIDMAWLQNPFDAISRAGDYEMYVTDDRDKKPASLTSTYLCSCFLYMHPTSDVKAVMRRWEFLMQGKPDHNQPRFNTAFHAIRKRSPGFAVMLPRSEFPPGVIETAHPTVLHANGRSGEEKKKSYLEKHGAWSLK